jgi:hypothetical protein
MTRGRRGRRIAQAELVLGGLVALFVGPFWFVASPGWMDGGPDPRWMLAGLAIGILGFAWMVRIYRADPEPDQRAWRYRDR